MSSGPRRSADDPPREEFAPDAAEEALAAFDRRTFLKLMGASLAAAGLATGCSSPQPPEKIVPYVDSPEGLVPGVPRFYASTLPTRGWIGGYGRGVIVEQHEGRPTKIEGNADHPSSLGATDIFMQAAILQMYDPDRSTTPRRGEEAVGWGNILESLRAFIARRGGAAKVRVGLLTSTITSPSVTARIRALQQVFPGLAWHVHDPLGQPNARQGQKTAIGRSITPVFHFLQAKRIVSLDAHFLAEEAGATGGTVRYAREFAHARRLPFQEFGPNQTHRIGAPSMPAPTAETMSRLYVAESVPTYTGAVADHRLPSRPGDIAKMALGLARVIADNGTAPAGLSPRAQAWLAAAAADLKQAGPAALVLAGEYQPPEVHALCHGINAALGAIGTTITYHEPVETSPDDAGSLAALVRAMAAGQIDLLLLLDTNPAYNAPSDLHFAEALAEFSKDADRLAVSLTGYVDETAALCGLHVPLSHPLEAWGDVRGHDGTISLFQPLIRPLWASKSVLEFLAGLAAVGMESSTAAASASVADLYADGYELLHDYWMGQWPDAAPTVREARFQQALREGVMPNTASPAVTATVAPLAQLLQTSAPFDAATASPIDVVFRPDPAIADGFWANHPWLQEMPKPLTHITWDTLAVLSPATAKSLGIDPDGYESRGTLETVRLHINGRTVDLPAWVQAGQADGVVAAYLGGGRRSGGTIQDGIGVDIYPLRTSAALWTAASDARLERGTEIVAPACTQATLHDQGRDIARGARVADLKPPTAAVAKSESPARTVSLSLYEQRPYDGYRWGMVVDLSACIGCSACVVACVAENNSPTVGRDQVRRGREMHWMRIDTYEDPHNVDNPFRLQPMFCQHCEDAPCELVCPVEATSHSEEGINEMTYNRCIGTRYCSNNCPYKVRRFNFLHYTKDPAITWSMQKNPNVTVRSRGVMEKCTYCIQRVNRARISAKREWARQESSHGAPVEMRDPGASIHADDALHAARPLPRLRFQTACQQACPAEALIFGDLNDQESLAGILKTQQPWADVHYGVLSELNTLPRTTYLARIANPNPALAAKPGGAA